MRQLSQCLMVVALLAEAGCTTLNATDVATNPPLQTLYDTRLIDAATAAAQTLPALTPQLASADVVVIGEYHGHPAAHLLQSQVQQALYQARPNQVLTLEQFAIDRQPALDLYLQGETGEREMMEDAAAWDNYRASYRPLVEFAIANGLPVVAANAPANVVRCVGRLGPGYLDSLPAEVRDTLPEQPFVGSDAYRDKFLSAMGEGRHGAGDQGRLMNSYQAQLLRDNTMASRILLAHQQHPGAQIIHLTGTFHSESHLGTIEALQHRAPELSIAVLSPVHTNSDGEFPDIETHRHKGDVLYLLRPLPVPFKDPERQIQHFQQQFAGAPAVDCTPAR
ncbi:ChaN family lipoprotein [Marinobacter zhejiangensis]|uniref:Uncharacterized iron-regulated protein n=1 Tax=Marinobacter zhejiangensis TaxID=488535 RepID=A0A1I4KZ96_9GAMM|nr:ChaN family lipoprotein [Marinobacter zhejiangensis]SFL84001.1 Uncharacterized iron-regulated protein [Marinobacter zhejiangensis]